MVLMSFSGSSESGSWSASRTSSSQRSAAPQCSLAARIFFWLLMKTTAAARLRTLRSHLDCRPAPAALEIQDDGLTAEELVRSLFALRVLCSAPCALLPSPPDGEELRAL